MPRCTNDSGNDKRYYKGTEPSPKGLGRCAGGYDIKKHEGHTEEGSDGKLWILRKQSTNKGTEFLVWRKQVTNLEAKAPVETKGTIHSSPQHQTLKASDYFERVVSNGDNAVGHVCRVGSEMKCLQVDKRGPKWWKKGTRSDSACQWDRDPPRDCHTTMPPPRFTPSRSSPALRPSSSTAQKQGIVDLCAMIGKESVRLTGPDVDRVRDILEFVWDEVRSGDPEVSN
jgi:hypothetical protein